MQLWSRAILVETAPGACWLRKHAGARRQPPGLLRTQGVQPLQQLRTLRPAGLLRLGQVQVQHQFGELVNRLLEPDPLPLVRRQETRKAAGGRQPVERVVPLVRRFRVLTAVPQEQRDVLRGVVQSIPLPALEKTGRHDLDSRRRMTGNRSQMTSA